MTSAAIMIERSVHDVFDTIKSMPSTFHRENPRKRLCISFAEVSPPIQDQSWIGWRARDKGARVRGQFPGAQSPCTTVTSLRKTKHWYPRRISETKEAAQTSGWQATWHEKNPRPRNKWRRREFHGSVQNWILLSPSHLLTSLSFCGRWHIFRLRSENTLPNRAEFGLESGVAIQIHGVRKKRSYPKLGGPPLVSRGERWKMANLKFLSSFL